MKARLPLLLLFCFAVTSPAQAPDSRQFIRAEAPAVALARVRYMQARARVSTEASFVAPLRKAMDFERAFARAGGLPTVFTHLQGEGRKC